MRVAIHQPNFLPWIGYFHKMASCDVFIYLDDVQYTKNSYQNRVLIKTPQDAQWLTLPVRHKFGQLTNEVMINDATDWRRKHLKTLEMNYRKSPNFAPVFALLSGVYEAKDWTGMSEFNIALLEAIRTVLGIRCQVVKSSELNVTGQSTQRLINLVQQVRGTEYLSGGGGSKYQEESMFEAVGIKLCYSDFSHPMYPQLWGEFAKGLSVIDLMFNDPGAAALFSKGGPAPSSA